jgi:hypothetical protein
MTALERRIETLERADGPRGPTVIVPQPGESETEARARTWAERGGWPESATVLHVRFVPGGHHDT